MAQLTGSGFGHGTNYAMVGNDERLWVDSSISGIVAVSGTIVTKIGVNTQVEIIRSLAGSPSSWYLFTQVVDGFILDCIGSNPIYYALSGTLDSVGSETGFLDTYNNISFDLQIGSIQIESSGASNTEFQLTGVI